MEKDSMVQVYVPEGEFLMGSVEADSQDTEDELPQHLVYLDSFWIDQTEVSNRMYKACVDMGKCSLPSPEPTKYQVVNGFFSKDSYYQNLERQNYPVIGVSWNDANTYCAWAGRRLPTEAEWEKAARGTNARKYPWGNQSPTGQFVNFCDKTCTKNEDDSINDGYAYTSPIGSYPDGASPYGALDMAGNVWEWVADSYDANYYYSDSHKYNPILQDNSNQKVYRGGWWSYTALPLRVADRRHVEISHRGNAGGFRCAASP